MNAKMLLVLAGVGLLGAGCAVYVPLGPPPGPPPPSPYTQGGPPPYQPPPPGAPGDQGYNPAGADQPPPPGADQPPPGADQPPPGDDQPPAGAAPPPGDQDQADVGQFYNQLSPYGEWEQVPSYGWVWVPRGMAPGWRPYSVGHWVYSDAGWAWVSDEPFGWACYHYGRWFDDPGFGWAWVPGPVWAPAWVAWRSGGGYIGWAPLPPAVGWRAGFGLQLGGVDLNVAIGPTHFCFVGEHDFLSAHVHDVLLPPSRGVTLMRNTVNITNYTVVNNRVVNRGVAVDHIEKAVGHPIQAVRLASSSSPERAGVRGGTVAFYRPPVPAGRAAAVARPPARVAPNYSAEELDRRHQAERQDLERYQQSQRENLQALHQREMASQSSEAGRRQLAQQHAQEVQAQQQLHQRQAQVMQSRQQRERAAVPHPHH